jgi:hypothetical protein
MPSNAYLLAQMSERMREGRYRESAESFAGLLKEGVNTRQLGLDAITAASPFLNVPAHTMVTRTGEIRAVNYDHTVLAFWRSYRMATRLPKEYRNLSLLQAMWYLPQGLDIWSQILCEFPGHYANEQEKCPTINLRGPKQHFEEQPPLTDGTWEERLQVLLSSIVHGDRAMAFRAFLGLADEAATDEGKRKELESNILFAGITDLPGPRVMSIHIVNSAHKGIRARAMVELANTLGWERAYPVYLIVIPDLATHPHFQDIFETGWLQLMGTFGPQYLEKRHSLTQPMSVRETERYIDLMLHGTPDELFRGVTELIKQEKSLFALNDAAVIAAARLQARVETPGIRAGFTNTDHAFDYANVVGYWLRNYDHPHQVKAPYYTAHFVNDVSRFLKQRGQDASTAMPSQPEEHAARADRLSLGECLAELGLACDVQDAPYAHAVLESYLGRTRERRKLIDTLTLATAKWEGDPHMPRAASSHHEEFLHSALPLSMKDDLFRSWVRFVARSHKRSYEFTCLDLYEREFVKERVPSGVPVPPPVISPPGVSARP